VYDLPIQLEFVTEQELAAYGLSARDVRPRCPQAVEYTSLGGGTCWLLEDLAELFCRPEEGQTA
jgi:hypothetical protein